MTRYLILFNAIEDSKDFIAASTPEQVQASIDAWIKWKDALPSSIAFEWGLPVRAVGNVSASGQSTSDNHASGYAIMEAESKESVLTALQTHPHIIRNGATIDVLETLPMQS